MLIPEQIIALALLVGASPKQACLIAAFAHVESSGRPDASGDGGLAHGLYQFHAARWEECGGLPDDRLIAPPLYQTAVMLLAIRRYTPALRYLTDEDWVVRCGRYHNIGHPSSTHEHTPYTKRLYGLYLRYSTDDALHLRAGALLNHYRERYDPLRTPPQPHQHPTSAPSQPPPQPQPQPQPPQEPRKEPNHV